MKKYAQNEQILSNLSEFSSQCNWEINNEQISNLYETKKNFLCWLQTIGQAANLPLSAQTIRYSKQILNENLDGNKISTLMDRRVEKMIKNHKIKKNWCKQDCTILAWILQRLTNGRHVRAPQKIKNTYWQTLATLIPGVTADQCMFKWLNMKKTKLSNNRWSQHESRLLQQIVKQFENPCWKKISRALFLHNELEDKKFRTAKQCREQWNCYLNPTVKKGPWSIEEDLKLLKCVDRDGRKWSMICKQYLSGRTENAVKNRYNFVIQHKKQQHPQLSQSSLLKICLNELQQTSNSKHQSPKIGDNEQQRKQFKHQGFIKMQQQQPIVPKITIVECNFQQITKYLKTNHILVPAKIDKDQLIQYDGLSEKCIKVKLKQVKEEFQ